MLLDIVPNHMAVDGRANRWWWDVLENGPGSRWATAFDIDWDPPEAKLRHTVLVPILGDHYGRVLESCGLSLAREDGSIILRYAEHELPISLRSLDELFAAAATASGVAELASLGTVVAALPVAPVGDRERAAQAHREKEKVAEELARLCREVPEAVRALDAEIARHNGDPDALDALLERQWYRLAFWRTAGAELDYRRFFDITNLVALRVEDAQVFADTHALVAGLVRNGCVQGIRVDHPDGLRDPGTYLRRLRAEVGDVPVLVEKITAPGERLPESWPVDGTTGYDFLNDVGRLFVDPEGLRTLAELHARFTGDATSWDDVARQSRQDILRSALAADLARVTAAFVDVCERHRRHRDYTRRELRCALAETLASLDAYRTYVSADTGQVREEDIRRVRRAVGEARERRSDLDPTLLDFLGDVLLLRHRGVPEGELAMRFQQLSAAVMAKGIEDTAFYRSTVLLSENEVGGHPGPVESAVEAFHARNVEAQQRWPQALLATSTHDTKRSEDVRARLAALSEIPAHWAAAVWQWAEMNERHRTDGMPDRGLEYLFYQTAVGAFPLPADRAGPYLEKAAKEAKRHTSWTHAQPEFDQAVQRFVQQALGDPSFTAALGAFVTPLVEVGRINALAQTLLKLTCPGVPDLYQGTELWDLSLVDPDNRRPVDFAARRRALDRLEGLAAADVLANADDGSPKLWLVRHALRLRRARAEAFGADGTYEPLPVAGRRAGHAVAFLRGESVAVIVPRLVVGLGEDWQDTAVTLPRGIWVDVLSGAEVEGGALRLADLLSRFPVALFSRR